MLALNVGKARGDHLYLPRHIFKRCAIRHICASNAVTRIALHAQQKGNVAIHCPWDIPADADVILQANCDKCVDHGPWRWVTGTAL